MMTTADRTNHFGSRILAQSTNQLVPATPFDMGAGSINPAQAIDPGLIFDANFSHYVDFLCAVPGVDHEFVKQSVGIRCPMRRRAWCSDLNTASVTISNLVGSRKVIRCVTNVARKNEFYRVTVREPVGVNVTVSPNFFWIRGNASRHLRIWLRTIKAKGAHRFGEITLHGSRNHIVRVPVVVYARSR
ncbi:hypothetical protein JCGZ_03490 [Jatropha curcas]|uniref:Subtilisin-like protease fibronectin type-III domain-containing protein n=2 Tax=Jatropha curcas TaxID=180498 RepID=A0A067L775_JATCU|nr:hypothetical protein JCGZ_03490 [Jatropha curcas]